MLQHQDGDRPHRQPHGPAQGRVREAVAGGAAEDQAGADHVQQPDHGAGGAQDRAPSAVTDSPAAGALHSVHLVVDGACSAAGGRSGRTHSSGKRDRSKVQVIVF